ncbi:Fic family protein [Pseudomonas kuykendallii]|jgi:fido (protein-threonine AMPylation protein)|uniref:protein adenylyltransferase n=1 Tax=Pseudomonas kuykendallii TaxID=1007099 RepID=A0A2W5CRF7_9PSED|nr:Fic family protein [Pseudomonas kuykendallii]PZP20743.1 MAG: hypothetical protein DI599_21510 [Pseudomonas kuykendallii]
MNDNLISFYYAESGEKEELLCSFAILLSYYNCKPSIGDYRLAFPSSNRESEIQSFTRHMKMLDIKFDMISEDVDKALLEPVIIKSADSFFAYVPRAGKKIIISPSFTSLEIIKKNPLIVLKLNSPHEAAIKTLNHIRRNTAPKTSSVYFLSTLGDENALSEKQMRDIFLRKNSEIPSCRHDAVRENYKRMHSRLLSGGLDYSSLLNLHKSIFSSIYEHAGVVRTTWMSRGGNIFSPPEKVSEFLSNIESLALDIKFTSSKSAAEVLALLYSDLMAIHPFINGNGVLGEVWIKSIAERERVSLASNASTKSTLYEAVHNSHRGNPEKIIELFSQRVG